MTTSSLPKRVLMVDDDDMMRILFRETFWIHSRPGHEIEVVALPSLEEAVARLKETSSPFYAVFLGLWLQTKHEDGSTTRDMEPSLGFIAALRARPEYARVPIVVYSRYRDDESREMALRAGANHYLIKGDLSPRDMVDFVEQL